MKPSINTNRSQVALLWHLEDYNKKQDTVADRVHAKAYQTAMLLIDFFAHDTYPIRSKTKKGARPPFIEAYTLKKLSDMAGCRSHTIKEHIKKLVQSEVLMENSAVRFSHFEATLNPKIVLVHPSANCTAFYKKCKDNPEILERFGYTQLSLLF